MGVGVGVGVGGGYRGTSTTGRFICSVNRIGGGSGVGSSGSGSGVTRRTNGAAIAAAAAREEIVIDDTPPQQRRRTTSHQTNPHPNNPNNNANSSSPSAYSYVGGGALLGGMLGATNAYLHGRPLGPAALEGAFAGGVGGAAVNVAMSSSPGTSASAASAGQQMRNGGGAARAVGADAGAGAGAHGRGYRVGGGGGRAGAGHADAYLRHLQNELLRSMAGPPGYHGGRFGGGRYYYGRHHAMGPDIDNMTYDQLLARFGDGTENQDRGASAGQIASLPTSTVTNPNDLPNDCRECIVCMENFKRGDVRRTLPCLHSEFHAECVDRWLKSNATCPVCKHQITE